MSEQGRADARVIAAYEQERGVRTGLQTTTSSAVNGNSAAIEKLVNDVGDETIGQLAQTGVAVEGPVPYSLTMLPYRLLEQFVSEDVPVIPDSAKEISAAVDRFWPGDFKFCHQRYGEDMTEEVRDDTRAKLLRTLYGLVGEDDPADSWRGALRSLMSQQIETQAWLQYKAVHERQLADGESYTLDEIVFAALSNFDFNEKFGLFRHMTGRHQSFLFTSCMDSMNLPVMTRPRMPIGPYGPRLARKLLLVATVMSLFDERDRDLYNDAVTSENADLVHDHTTRATGYNAPPLAASFVSGVEEADQQAMPGSLSLLTGSRVKGYDRDDYDALVQRLIFDDMPDKLANQSQGLTATHVLYGTFIPDLVTTKRDGTHLKISSQGVDALQALREISNSLGAKAIRAHQQEVATYEKAYLAWHRAGMKGQSPKAPRPLVRTYTRCPYAGLDKSHDSLEPGAISRRGPAMLAVYECMRLDPSLWPERRRWHHYNDPLRQLVSRMVDSYYGALSPLSITPGIGKLGDHGCGEDMPM